MAERSDAAPRALILVPAFDEASHLPDVLARIRGAGLDAEIVVVDDGSRDATAEVASAAGATVLRHPFNLGYGAALQTGYKHALGRGFDVLVQMDADGQHDPAEVERLVAPILAGEADLVIGSRFLGRGDYRMSRLHAAGRVVFQTLLRWQGLALSDPTSGFQALSRRTLELYARDFFPSDYPDVDVLLTASRSGLRVVECAVRMEESPRASSLHGGWRSFYYVYKMILALWAASRRPGKEDTR